MIISPARMMLTDSEVSSYSEEHQNVMELISLVGLTSPTVAHCYKQMKGSPEIQPDLEFQVQHLLHQGQTRILSMVVWLSYATVCIRAFSIISEQDPWSKLEEVLLQRWDDSVVEGTADLDEERNTSQNLTVLGTWRGRVGQDLELSNLLLDFFRRRKFLWPSLPLVFSYDHDIASGQVPSQLQLAFAPDKPYEKRYSMLTNKWQA